MARCIHGHQMDRYARACPTCGAARDPGWNPPHRFLSHREEEMRRRVHFWMVGFFVLALMVIYVTFRPRSPVDPTREVCSTARGLYYTVQAPSGDEDAYSERRVGEISALDRIERYAGDVFDPDIKKAIDAMFSSEKSLGFPTLATIDALVKECGAKGFPGR